MSLTLLQAIRQRQKAAGRAGFHYGIGTADAYVKSVRECVGSDICYRFAASKSVSFDDVLRKAARTLVYSKDDLTVQEIDYQKQPGASLKEINGVTLPKNTLMVFRHKLTSPKEDRDGDILRSEGGRLDPKMLLLWQHVPTLPIGKLLKLENQDTKGIDVVSCIVDMNELSHDAAVMVDNDMGRFSHGFRALEFEEIRGNKCAAGYDVKEFEVMEESLVSVPSNTDAETSEVLLSLVEGGKMTSAIMKEYGKSIREKRPKRVNVPKDIPGEKAPKGDDDGAQGKGTGAGCGCGGKGKPAPSKKDDEAVGGKGKTAGAGRPQGLKKKKPATCPDCGKALPASGMCPCKEQPPKSARLGREYVDESIQNVILHATDEQKNRLIDVLQTMNNVKKANKEASFFRAVAR